MPARSASEKRSNLFGTIMNSWKSIGASECAPPLRMFIIGTGSTLAFGPPRYLKSGWPSCVGGGLRRGERDGEDGVRAELGFVRRAVERDHRPVDRHLVERVAAFELRGDRARSHWRRPCSTPLPQVAILHAVAQFPGFVFAGAGAARHGGAADRAAGELDIDFDGGIAAGIKDLAGADLLMLVLAISESG